MQLARSLSELVTIGVIRQWVQHLSVPREQIRRAPAAALEKQPIAAGHAVLNLRALPDVHLVEDLARRVCSGSQSQLYSVQSALGLLASGRVLLEYEP